MTVKELQKLKRQELLQLLLTQSKEVAGLKKELEAKDKEMIGLVESNERLGARVREKDDLNDRLRGRLEDKNIRIMNLEAELEAWKTDRRDELDKMDSIADAALKLNGVFETVQQAADQYLYNIRQRYEEESQRSAGRRS
jgi:predicted RNase H-like nuclease (RuvC/YqgF family)